MHKRFWNHIFNRWHKITFFATFMAILNVENCLAQEDNLENCLATKDLFVCCSVFVNKISEETKHRNIKFFEDAKLFKNSRCDKELQDDNDWQLHDWGVIAWRDAKNLYSKLSPKIGECNSGDVSACEVMSLWVDDEGVKIFAKKGCELNSGLSCAQYGDSLWNKEKYKEAYQIAEKSCNLNHAHACFFLGYQYSRVNPGIPRDMQKSQKFYQKACDLGHMESCNKL